MKIDLLTSKLKKNILSPFSYCLLSLRNKLPIESINIGKVSNPVVRQWAQNLGIGAFFSVSKLSEKIGPAIIKISDYKNFQHFSEVFNGKSSISYYNRLCLKKGYSFISLSRNNYIDDIYDINTSATIRQGRRMSSSYSIKVENYPEEDNYKYYGVIDANGKLVAYADTVDLNEVIIIYKILGHKDFLKDNIMYFLVYNVIKSIFEIHFNSNNRLKYLMYDSFFMNSEGLKFFKHRCGFKAYHIKWKTTEDN